MMPMRGQCRRHPPRSTRLLPLPPGEGGGEGTLREFSLSFPSPQPARGQSPDPLASPGGRGSRKTPRLFDQLSMALLILAASGCGYHWSGDGGANFAPEPGYAWHGLYREDVKTVAIPIFANKTYYRGVEFNLSKAVINQLESRTPYRVAPRERADTILEGEIINTDVRTLSRYPFNALPQEQLYHIVVNFTWKDLRSGKILVQRHSFEQTAPYYPTLGEDPFVGSQDTVERMALAIVEELQADWGNTEKQ